MAEFMSLRWLAVNKAVVRQGLAGLSLGSNGMSGDKPEVRR